jgi:hypothetical protein
LKCGAGSAEADKAEQGYDDYDGTEYVNDLIHDFTLLDVTDFGPLAEHDVTVPFCTNGSAMAMPPWRELAFAQPARPHH